eukprot:CAMPEP_0113311560 /NCGR_PEP_ID=MMETSP0010_2-20120614/8749_1 /TAXON_ID=216773 ORGANISM="Corethron hystrix, Strain 308" /NCGR_SAMPLE_ID=MMETSP0010_2 /ASSEMBLY_ACC=CAM_ASM_000155 /LENGTH=373 /DNA_ID=CAMNT_0000167225 /DNA_START=148 /DNA_END=1269 /DNA_ORIENTATION=- /assembly_acc=CAM_ASM_000155
MTKPLSSQLTLMDQFSVPKIPDIVKLETGQRLVAIGDIHGDFDQLRKALVISGVLDPRSTNLEPIWTGENTICVQCGDILDRGDGELACYRLLADLARQAHSQGGALSLLFGNHEGLNIEGLFQYAWKEGNAEFEKDIGQTVDEALGFKSWRIQFAGNQPSRWAAMEPGGLFAAPLLSSMKVAMVVGNSVLVHGGLTMEHLKYYCGIEEMNRVAREWVQQMHHKYTNHLGNYESVEEVIQAAQGRIDTTSKTLPKCLGGKGGETAPVWVRIYSSPSDLPPQNPLAQKMIDAVLSELGIDRMIMGHTPQKHINSALENKAWRIDVGASKGMGNGNMEVLEVTKNADGSEDVFILNQNNRIPALDRKIIPNSYFD